MHYRDSQGGAQYPRSLGEFQSWFATDADCLDYLEWLRWPDGFVCPRCENVGGWRVSDGSFKCTRCKAQTAVTAGTLFDRRRTTLAVWFQVCWEFATAKDGVSALAVKRTLPVSYTHLRAHETVLDLVCRLLLEKKKKKKKKKRKREKKK